jgi:hypothetical protein
MLAGITYLFAIANINGTLTKLTNDAVKIVRGNIALIPILLFTVLGIPGGRGKVFCVWCSGPVFSGGMITAEP